MVPIKLGANQLPHRLAMAPMTRSHDSCLVPDSTCALVTAVVAAIEIRPRLRSFGSKPNVSWARPYSAVALQSHQAKRDGAGYRTRTCDPLITKRSEIVAVPPIQRLPAERRRMD